MRWGHRLNCYDILLFHQFQRDGLTPTGDQNRPILALREIRRYRLPAFTIHPGPLSSLVGVSSLGEEIRIVDVIENKQPPPTLSAAQPVMDKSEDIRFGILPSRNLDVIGDIPKALLQPCCAPGMYPEHPRPGRLFSGSIAEFDGELRLSGPRSALRSGIFAPASLYLPDPAQAHQRCPRRRQGASSMKLLKDVSAIDKVRVPPKRDGR